MILLIHATQTHHPNPSTIVPIEKFTKSFNIEPHTQREVYKKSLYHSILR